MQARSKKLFPVTAFTGHEYPPRVWRLVPPGYEDEARRNPFLELKEDEVEVTPDEENVTFSPSEPIAVEPSSKRKRRG